MKKEEQSISETYRNIIAAAAEHLEIALGVVILLGCILAGIGLIVTVDISEIFSNSTYLQHKMSDTCVILIGVELIKMITSHTVDSVVDVMLVAVARQMIVEHTSPVENVLAVVAVTLLFVIRKYLYTSSKTTTPP